MTDTTTPTLSQVPASSAPSTPAASPAPAQPSPGPQGPPPSKAEATGWYAQTDVAPGETSGQFSPGNGLQPGEPGQPGQPERMPGDHGEPPSELQTALQPRQYQDFALPEGYTGRLDPVLTREFKEIFDAGRGENYQQSAQRLIDMHVAEIKKVGEMAAQYQRDVWNRTIEHRISEFRNDPEIGGARAQTTLGNAKFALERHLGLSPAEVQELLVVMDNGGVSNHRLLLKGLNNLYKTLAEPEPVTPNDPASSKMMSAQGGRDWYGSVDGPSRSGPR
jgi:hypothetical protein